MTMGIPIVAIWTYHQRKMMEMKLRMGGEGRQVVSGELQEIKQQLAELRDTTTRYDLSFDAALQRIESRVGHLESRVSSVEQQNVVGRQA